MQEAWVMATKCLKEALSYDIRIIPATTLEPLLKEHHNLMRSLLSEIVGAQLSDTSWRRVQLPGPLGGAGVTLPMTTADAAFVATWTAVAGRVAVVAQELGRPASRKVEEVEYEAAVQRLEAKGVKIDGTGQ
eukprot:2218837-Karenia_brevis.AAC.1